MKDSMTQTAIDTASIINWNDKRTTENTVSTIFTKAGNNFSFNFPKGINKDLHIYIGYSNEGNINFTLIEDINDTKKNTECADFVEISSSKDSLPNSSNPNPNPNAISWKVANERVSNWNKDDIRNTWISNQFKNESEDDAIAQVFVVNAMDIVAGENHQGYLGLVENENGTYAIDLIIVNSNNQIQPIAQIEDMVHSVPPFGDTYASFGLLNWLNIN
jgi:hypothetical protein